MCRAATLVVILIGICSTIQTYTTNAKDTKDTMSATCITDVAIHRGQVTTEGISRASGQRRDRRDVRGHLV